MIGIRWSMLAGVLAMACASTGRAESLAAQAFAELASLVGDWEGTPVNGRTHRVSFALTAADSVIVETWTLSPTRQSLTLYALDGDRLLATHYCPQGNQPRLVLAGREADGSYRFEFLDGTNLQDPDRTHQHSMEIAVETPQSFSRSETYVRNDHPAGAAVQSAERVQYRRVDP